MKTCAKCGETKTPDMFNRRTRAADGRDNWCRECNRVSCKAYNKSEAGQQKAHVRNIERYGLTVEEFEQRLVDQNGVCAICYEPEERFTRLCIDHCHATGKVRGLLCNTCNRALGLLKDNAQTLLRASQYVRKSNG